MSDTRPNLAIVANVPTPYRLHLHGRIARELTEMRLHSIFTHELSESWTLNIDPAINPLMFGSGERTDQHGILCGAAHEWAKAGRIIAHLRRFDVAAVLVSGYNDAGRLRLIRWCRRHGVPCLLVGDSNIRGDPATGLRRAVKTPLVRAAVRQCAGVLPCGSLGRDYFLRYGARSDRIFYFPYEPDYDLIARLTPEQIAATAAQHALAPTRRRAMFTGRLVPVKRVDLAIDAFVAVADRRPEWDLLVVGDGPLRAELEARVPPGLKGRVIFAGFVGVQAEVSALYRASDVLVLPSDAEPWALVVNEAAAAGLAIVASDVVGAAAELVREGVNGRTFPRGDLAALTAALEQVTDPARIDEMKPRSPEVLADWRRRGDPVKGLRQALRAVGALQEKAGGA